MNLRRRAGDLDVERLDCGINAEWLQGTQDLAADSLDGDLMIVAERTHTNLGPAVAAARRLYPTAERRSFHIGFGTSGRGIYGSAGCCCRRGHGKPANTLDNGTMRATRRTASGKN